MNTFTYKKVYITSSYTLLSSLAHKPIISSYVDKVVDDYYMKKKSVEEAESEYQNICIKEILKKNKLKETDIDILISGDLQNQISSSVYSAKNFDIPHIGVYSACASFAESMLIGASFIESNTIKKALIVSSSHNLVAEKQFRFPIEYGSLKKKINSFTVSGSVSTLMSNTKSNIKLVSSTIGKVVDIGYKDTNNFGALMAPSASKTLYEHLKNTKTKVDDYDLILTGDLGVYGILILKEYFYKLYNIELKNIIDCGAYIYNCVVGSSFSGGSGPICWPLVFFSKFSKSKKYNKILVIATGALHSSSSANRKETLPSISHVLSLEVNK
ncbi:MAG: stage V sporulation protein AD [Bacilli bacterium]